MGNMSYCRFENTCIDLQDCYDNIDEQRSESEEKYFKKIIKLCSDIAIDFNEDYIRDQLGIE